MALFAVSFYPCRTAVLEPEPLALVLFLLIFLESWLVLSGRNDTLQEFLLSASTTLGQHTPAGHHPIISSSTTTVGTVSGTPGSQEIALLAAVLN